MRKEQQKLHEEYITLKIKYNKTMERVQTLENDNKTLENDKKQADALLLGHNVTCMFVHYKVEPVLKGKLWQDVIEQIKEKKADLEDNIITQEEFSQWTQTTFPGIGDVSIVKIQELNEKGALNFTLVINSHQVSTNFSFM